MFPPMTGPQNGVAASPEQAALRGIAQRVGLGPRPRENSDVVPEGRISILISKMLKTRSTHNARLEATTEKTIFDRYRQGTLSHSLGQKETFAATSMPVPRRGKRGDG